jgi:hypothetical protein
LETLGRSPGLIVCKSEFELSSSEESAEEAIGNEELGLFVTKVAGI